MFPAAGIDFVPVAHEQNAVHMADGYARVTGRPPRVVSQNGPGITNFVTGVAAAYWAHTPMVVVTPSAGTLGVGLGGFQETEQLPIFSKITKWQVQVNRPERMAELMRRAFYVAKAEAGPGPGRHPSRLLLRRERVRDLPVRDRPSAAPGRRSSLRRGAGCWPAPATR